MEYEDTPRRTYLERQQSELAPEQPTQSTVAVRLNRSVYWLARHWLLVFIVAYGAFNLLPWLAPLFMEIGWAGPGKAIYFVYSFLCHQLPQRSFFLFGAQPMYELNEVQAAWQNTNNPLVLRQFVGNPQMGWKVAWSDRMVSMYTGIWLWAVLLGLWRRRLPRLPLWGLLLLALPMVLDGGTHMISDWVGGVGGGFRYGNGWLATLTNGAFSPGFYAGDGLGTFNSWMRLVTGLLFSLGAVWFALPEIAAAFGDTAGRVKAKFDRAGLAL
jgi:uncharacterized membrane protein